MSTLNATSVVTPASANGATPNRAARRAAKSTNPPKLDPVAKTVTRTDAIATASEYGKNIAGQDGQLTAALKAFAKNDEVQGEMLQALSESYYMRKMGVDLEEAKRVLGLKKHNPNKEGEDGYRSFEQERVMVAIRVLWSRARKMAGISVVSPGLEAAAATREAKKAEREEHESRLIAADAIINPASDVNPFDGLARQVLSMRSYANKNAAKLTGDQGMAWRDWLAAAPLFGVNVGAPKTSK